MRRRPNIWLQATFDPPRAFAGGPHRARLRDARLRHRAVHAGHRTPRCPEAHLSQHDAADWKPTEIFDGAVCLIDSFRHLDVDVAERFLDRLAGALSPGSAFAFGLDLSDPSSPSTTGEVEWEGELDGLRVLTQVRSGGVTGPRSEIMETRVRVLAGAPEDELVVMSHMTTWTHAQLEAALNRAGFAIESVHDRYYDSIGRLIRSRGSCWPVCVAEVRGPRSRRDAQVASAAWF